MDKERKAVDELLRALELDALIRQVELEEILPQPKSLEKALEEVKKHGQVLTRAGRLDGRIAAGKRRAKKNISRKKKNARQQRWRRNWKEKTLSKAVQGDVYHYYKARWNIKGRKWVIGEEEWNTYVKPCLPVGEVVELRRYDTKAPTTLHNLVVYDSSGVILFDGKEWLLRKQGYIL